MIAIVALVLYAVSSTIAAPLLTAPLTIPVTVPGLIDEFVTAEQDPDDPCLVTISQGGSIGPAANPIIGSNVIVDDDLTNISIDTSIGGIDVTVTGPSVQLHK